MGRKKTPAPDAEATKIRIVETAESLFRRFGYAKTTVVDIAKVLGMSAANVYRYFPAKSAINEAICERLVKRIEERSREVMDLPGTAPERLGRFFLEYHRSIKEYVLKERRLYDMVAVAMQEHWAVILSHSERIQGLLRRLLDDGVAAGAFRGMDTDAMSKSLHESMVVFLYPAFVEHLVMEAAQAGHEEDTERELTNLLDLVLCGLRA